MLWVNPVAAHPCMWCGRSCNCNSNGRVVTFIDANYPAPKTTAALEWEELKEDARRARQKKWETKLRFLESIRPANQPKRFSIPAISRSFDEPPRRRVRQTRFRGIARSRPGYRGRTDGKRKQPTLW